MIFSPLFFLFSAGTRAHPHNRTLNCRTTSPTSWELCWKGCSTATSISDSAAEEEGKHVLHSLRQKSWTNDKTHTHTSIIDISRRAEEVKDHPFFLGVDWQQVYMQKYPPPLIPPRGEVNAADAFDIGSFDEEDTKGYKVSCSLVTISFKSLTVWMRNLKFELFLLVSAVDGEGPGAVPKLPTGHFRALAIGSLWDGVRHHQPRGGQSRGEEEVQTPEIRSRRERSVAVAGTS